MQKWQGAYLVDVDFLRFLERYVTGLIRQHVLAMMAQAPGRVWRPEEIANAIGRPTTVTSRYLESMAREGLVIAVHSNGYPRYMLSPDPHVRAMVQRLRTRGPALPLIPHLSPRGGTA